MAAAQSGAYNYYHGFPTPGPQCPSSEDVFNHIFFASETKWKECRETKQFDYVVIGSGFCGYAFVDEIYKQWEASGAKESNAPKVLMLERGTFFLPVHVQNLPLAFANALPPEQKYMSETFPWVLSHKTITSEQACKWQHGMVPFVGGRSTLWSAWCPRPIGKFSELDGWPKYITEMMTDEFFTKAENLLHVQMPSDGPLKEMRYAGKTPVYSGLQRQVHERLAAAVKDKKITSATRMQDAPMAIGQGDSVNIDFAKYSVVGPLLELAKKYEKYFTIATNCAVQRIIHVDGVATALETSRGILPLVVPKQDNLPPEKTAQVILAVGCMPAATLLLNSFHADPAARVPGKPIPGETFSAHFITAVAARLPRAIFNDIGAFELGAIYLAGVLNRNNRSFQWHAQISVVSDSDPQKNKGLALRYQPDEVACASQAQLADSKDHVVFVFAVLGEIDIENPDNFFRLQPPSRSGQEDITANCILQFLINDNDKALWNEMDRAAFDGLNAIADKHQKDLQYWDGSANKWVDSGAEPHKTFEATKFRVPGLVHESCLLPWREDEKKSCVDRNFRYQESKNVFVTGSAHWPTGASWNPTMTMVGFSQKLAENLWNNVNGDSAKDASVKKAGSSSSKKRDSDDSKGKKKEHKSGRSRSKKNE